MPMMVSKTRAAMLLLVASQQEEEVSAMPTSFKDFGNLVMRLLPSSPTAAGGDATIADRLRKGARKVVQQSSITNLWGLLAAPEGPSEETREEQRKEEKHARKVVDYYYQSKQMLNPATPKYDVLRFFLNGKDRPRAPTEAAVLTGLKGRRDDVIDRWAELKAATKVLEELTETDTKRLKATGICWPKEAAEWFNAPKGVLYQSGAIKGLESHLMETQSNEDVSLFGAGGKKKTGARLDAAELREKLADGRQVDVRRGFFTEGDDIFFALTTNTPYLRLDARMCGAKGDECEWLSDEAAVQDKLTAWSADVKATLKNVKTLYAHVAQYINQYVTLLDDCKYHENLTRNSTTSLQLLMKSAMKLEEKISDTQFNLDKEASLQDEHNVVAQKLQANIREYKRVLDLVYSRIDEKEKMVTMVVESANAPIEIQKAVQQAKSLTAKVEQLREMGAQNYILGGMDVAEHLALEGEDFFSRHLGTVAADLSDAVSAFQGKVQEMKSEVGGSKARRYYDKMRRAWGAMHQAEGEENPELETTEDIHELETILDEQVRKATTVADKAKQLDALSQYLTSIDNRVATMSTQERRKLFPNAEKMKKLCQRQQDKIIASVALMEADNAYAKNELAVKTKEFESKVRKANRHADNAHKEAEKEVNGNMLCSKNLCCCFKCAFMKMGCCCQ